MKPFFVPLTTAIRFLTLLPIPWYASDDKNHFHASLYYFPVVGFFIGAIAYSLSLILCIFLPIQVVSVAILFFLAFISGCLHLDGVADSADGLLCSRSREKALAIMKDSRTGAMGVIGVVFVLLGKYAALSSMTDEMFCLSVFFMPLVGRCVLVFIIATQQYARKEGGLGTLFYTGKSKKAAIFSLFVLLVVFVLFCFKVLPVLAVTLFISMVFFSRWCNSKFGGATGDTLGASCEIAELVTALSFVTLL